MIHDTNPAWVQTLRYTAARKRRSDATIDGRAFRGLICAGVIGALTWGLTLTVLL